MFKEMGDTLLPYCLNIRLKYSEDIFQAAYIKQGGTILTGVEMTSFDLCDTTKEKYSKTYVRNNRTGEKQLIER
jgi:hypothetical protein